MSIEGLRIFKSRHDPVTTLDRAGAASNTLVVFSSDNGPWYQGSAGPLRGRKGSTWEGGQRVPFIARFPGRIPRGKVSHGVAGVMDLHPTIAKLCGAEARNPFDGVDIWPLLTAKQPALEREAFLSLCGERKTQERIAHTLKTGKPLRN